MQLVSHFISALAGLILCTGVMASPIASIVEEAKRSTGVQGSVGVIVSKLDHTVLYEFDADSYFTPASTTKTFLAVALMKNLSEDFRYSTKLRYKLVGNDAQEVSIELSGDPSFKTQDLATMLTDLKSRGVHNIKGTIYLEDVAFKGPWYGPGWTLDSKHWYYSAPISGIMINKNAIPIGISNKVLHQTIQLKPALVQDAGIIVKSSLKAVSEHEAQNCSIDAYVSANNDFKIRGCWPVTEPRANFVVAVEDPTLYFKQQLNYALKNIGIHFSGKIVTASTKNKKNKANYVIEHRSVPLDTLIDEVLVNSDNIVSESLYKQLGLVTLKEGSFVKGRLAMSHAYESLTQSKQSLMLYDGSGQSRYSLVTPRQLNELMIYCWNDARLHRRIIPHLARSGHPGTLNSRLKELSFKGKTGSMKGVRVLTGYLGSSDPLVITVMIDKSINKDAELPSLVDTIVRGIAALEHPKA